jgi:hypothetical protein
LAELQDEVLEVLLADPVFNATWRRQRPGFEGHLAFDREIARAVLDRDYDAQLAVDAVIHCRRLHGFKAELRRDYFDRLLSWAKNQIDEPPELVQAEERDSRPKRRRPQISVAADDIDQVILRERAKRAGLSVSNFVRRAVGLVPIYPGRPDVLEIAKLQDVRIEMLERLGIDPRPYFIGSDVGFPEDDD